MTGAPLAVLVARLDHELETMTYGLSTDDPIYRHTVVDALERAQALLEQIRTHRDLGGR